MARRGHHYRRAANEPAELNITTFLNLMVVLVPFLLITAVFSRITIMELNMPSGNNANTPEKAKMAIEVVVRNKGLEISNGRSVIARFPKIEEDYDLEKLSEYLLKIKSQYRDKTDATVLMEPDIEYHTLITVMDVVRVAEVVQGGNPEPQEIELFPNVSIGDAP
jgi:biopolymer transport protein ExbD